MTPTDEQIRRELAAASKLRNGQPRDPWWECRISYLIRAGRQHLIEQERLYEIRARARLVARRRTL